MPDDTTTVINPGLVVHLEMDEIVSGQVKDSTDFGVHGTVYGDPLVVDDNTFGKCLSFDGDGDYLELAEAVNLGISDGTSNVYGLKDNNFTVSAWVNHSVFKNEDSTVLGTDEREDYKGLHLTVRDQKPFMGFFTMDIPGSVVMSQNRWYHVAFIYDKDLGKQLIYVDGVLDTGDYRGPFLGTGILRVGRWSSERYFNGKMAHFRIYNRALTAQELINDMTRDKASDTSMMELYNAAHPLDFYLNDDDGRHVMYIDDAAQTHNLDFEIVNRSDQAVSIPAGSGTVSATNYHFELRFRPVTLSSASKTALAALTAPGTNWSMAYAHNDSNGSDSLYFLSTAERTLNAGGTEKITLPNVTADPGKGARGTRVETLYAGLTYRNETISGHLLEHMSIINHTGKEHIPLHSGFQYGNKVQNDGNIPNYLYLRLTNVLEPDPDHPERAGITFNGTSHTNPTKFILSFDSEASGESKSWALATDSQVRAIAVEVRNMQSATDTNWTITLSDVSERPYWELQPANDVTLNPGDHFTIRLSNVITSHNDGFSNLYLQYENVPGYWDGKVVSLIEKTALVLRKYNSDQHIIYSPLQNWFRIGAESGLALWGDGNADDNNNPNVFINNQGCVGIGTNSPDKTLHIESSSYHPLLIESKNPSGDTISQLIMKSTGDVGIGTDSPQASLHINTQDTIPYTNLILDGKYHQWELRVEKDLADPENKQYLYFYCYHVNNGVRGSAIEVAKLDSSGNLTPPSDLTLKDNIMPLQEILEKVLQLKPISFKWKDGRDDSRQLGFGAQDVEEVFPELVSEGSDGIKSLNYNGLIAPAIAAIREQQEKIDALEAKVADLSKKLEALLDKE